MSNKGKGSAKANAGPQRTVLLIVCGLPGSGKSTLAKNLEKFGWVRINQDDLGTGEECKKALEKALKHNKSVVLDRCNVHPKERKMWIQEAKKINPKVEVECLFLDLDAEACKLRARERKKHPTLSPENVDAVVDEFSRGLKPPEQWEGYKKIMVSKSDEETKPILKELSAYSFVFIPPFLPSLLRS